MHARRVRAALPAAAVLAMLSQACATLRVPDLVPESTAAGWVEATGRAGDIAVAARPIERLEENWSLFDDDLPRLGLAAVVITVRNSGSSEFDVGRLRIRLHSAAGRKSPALGNEAILEAYYSGRGTRLYSVRAHEEAAKALDRIGLRPALLGPGGEVSGLLFFRIEPAAKEHRMRGITLAIRGFPRVNGRRPTLDLVLDNARR